MFFNRPILAIETSCDETSAALVIGHELRSNVIASQVEMHAKWGGIVPEAASRAHVESIIPVLREAMGNMPLTDLGAIAVTNRPGLIGALSVGLSAAKALSLRFQIPLLGIHHLEGHLLSICSQWPEAMAQTPILSLIASGGHTELVRVDGLGEYTILAETLDDAAGEAFDKGARLLGLGYPGGAAIESLAREGDRKRYSLPQGMRHAPEHFSFSGLKTAVLRLVEKEGAALDRAGAAASLQHAVVEALARKVEDAIAPEFRALSLVGGVAANTALRARLHDIATRKEIPFYVPERSLCTDNAAMIGLAASLRLARGQRHDASLDAYPNSPLPAAE